VWCDGFYCKQGNQPTTGEVDMFARKVSARLKPDALTEFTNLMEREILPWLRTQEGFLDLITLAAPDCSEVAAISFWDNNGNALAYNSSGYPKALEILGKLLDGAPYVKTFDVVSSTFRGTAIAPPPEAENLARETASAQLGCRSPIRPLKRQPIPPAPPNGMDADGVGPRGSQRLTAR
jgi:hypothetical protein